MLYDVKMITKNYGGRDVLNLSISFEKGRVTGLLGPNGSGKTTLLEILAFISRPTSGEIFYKDSRVDFSKTDLIELRKRTVLVQQKPILFTDTVFSNVAFPLKIRGVKKDERIKTVNQLLAMVGMESLSRSIGNRLSGGEIQRVAIAQALACSPEVILMDEPTSSVDVENQIIIEGIIRDINRLKGISVIFTTHDRIQASRVADNIIYLHEGKVSESVHENIFSGTIETHPSGKTFCIIQGTLKIPVITHKTGQVRISLNPDSISINRERGFGDDLFNIRGKVIQLSDEKGSIRMLIDIGVPLTLIMPPENIRGLLPVIGEYMWIILDPEKIDIF